ncbi:hypothetical protein EAH88_03145 [Rhodanobacter glycinis]|uniref:Uncharacterized protein n=1 Tax=Rhodanobacter glycinis TaxID=582702 RepID=A0A502CIF4_9GAMM|nr:hypothetical protein [Rhodanobacter glycinis]TPG11521.1 hypothetical protein EAH88_03145 [Rhodanobacter glycinis]
MLDRPCREPKLMRTLPAPMRRLLWLLGVLYACYLIGGNIFLNSPLAPAEVNRKPEIFQAQWAWAWTLWPGQIHAHDLRLHGHARQLLWSAQGDVASGRIMLWPLLRRELRFGPVRTTAVSLDIQPTSIDLKPPPWRSDAWRITVDRISTVSLRQVRLGDLVADGGGEAELGFTHQLRGGSTAIFPSRVLMPKVRLRYRQLELLHDARLDVHFAFDPFIHEQLPGWQKLERAKIHAVVEGATPSIALGADKAGALAVRLSPLDGHLSADFLLDHGTLAPGGHLQWNAPVAITDADGTQQQRRGQLDLAVQADAVMIDARIPPPTGAGSAMAANQLEAHLQFASRQLLPRPSSGEVLRLLSGTVEGRWHFASLNWLAPLTMSKPWLQLDGAGDIVGALQIDAGRLAPGTHVDVPQVALVANILDNVFAGSAQAQARVVAGAGGTRLLADLAMERFTLAPRAAAGQAYLRGHALQVNLQSSDDLARFRQAFTARLHFADADIPDLRAYNRYLPGKSLYFLQGAGRMSTDFSIDGKGDVSAGHMQMSSAAARLALGVSRLAGKLTMDTRIDRARRAGHAFDLENFTLDLDGVRMEGSHAPPWWAKITLQHGRLDWDRPMRVRGSATLVMKDVSLLLSLFADRSAFPKWIANVINDGRATAHAEVEAQRGDFILDHLVASNRRIDLFAHLHVSEGKPSGDLYARWGVLGLGVALADGKRHFHLLHAQRWYQAQPDLIPAEATSTR